MKIRAWNNWRLNMHGDFYFRLFEFRWWDKERRFIWVTICNFTVAIIFRERGKGYSKEQA